VRKSTRTDNFEICIQGLAKPDQEKIRGVGYFKWLKTTDGKPENPAPPVKPDKAALLGGFIWAVCERCGTRFKAKRTSARFCGSTCRNRSAREATRR